MGDNRVLLAARILHSRGALRAALELSEPGKGKGVEGRRGDGSEDEGGGGLPPRQLRQSMLIRGLECATVPCAVKGLVCLQLLWLWAQAQIKPLSRTIRCENGGRVAQPRERVAQRILEQRVVAPRLVRRGEYHGWLTSLAAASTW
eukprot:CAMPEP_0119369476 /NCGR_PEP_ID=MMETSP1334-20130426/15980_1 /TAXON_ID=127549 /ORGANISM="Calcidiscus leptoporus, Strain RCC1130" /LENGTH=145 /DNA_ID=CAMNT_0007386325 /DNA_START=411 /DNA_END=846 /DNA_ORIENTATION=-